MTEHLGLNAADVALIVGMVQCGLIAWGINQMRESNKSRDVLIQSLEQQMVKSDQHTRALDRQLAASEQQTQALAVLLERTA